MVDEKRLFQLTLIREIVTAFLAVGLIVSGGFLVYFTLGKIGNTTEFGAAKDILLFMNPILGVVIGYYFNKTSSENRGDRAEAAAASATRQAIQAETEKAAVKSDRDTMSNTLSDLVGAARDSAAAGGKTLGAGQLPDSRLLAAIERAESILGTRPYASHDS